MLPVNSDFRRRENSTENQVQFWHATFANPALGQKCLKEISV